MGWQRFTVDLLQTIAWPVVVVGLALLFRAAIRSLLARATRVEFPGGGVLEMTNAIGERVRADEASPAVKREEALELEPEPDSADLLATLHMVSEQADEQGAGALLVAHDALENLLRQVLQKQQVNLREATRLAFMSFPTLVDIAVAAGVLKNVEGLWAHSFHRLRNTVAHEGIAPEAGQFHEAIETAVLVAMRVIGRSPPGD